MHKIAAIILAAGHGTRMRSSLPKVLHPLLGEPLVNYALAAAREATGQKPYVVVGYAAEAVHAAVGDQAHFVIQNEQLGTGHAVQQAAEILRDQSDFILVITADMPLLTADTLQELIARQRSHTGPITILTANAADPRGFGRVVRAADGSVARIVEEAQATADELRITELNVSAYCFRADWLWQALPKIPLSPKGEYYLTDLVGIAVEAGEKVSALPVIDPQETIGINTRVHLAEARMALQRRINHQWMLSGVTLIDPERTYIEPGVMIGQDTVIWPGTYLHGNTVIGPDCEIGPNTLVYSSQIGAQCRIFNSVVEFAVLEEHVEVGPFGHLRKGAHLGTGVHMGNFGEVKNSYLGPGTKMGHFSYLGDANIGPEVNIGAGTITCNYDGERKHSTEIGAGAFIGSDTMLVAPVKIGAGARTGAGSVVTRNVPDESLAVGVPARVIRKLKERD